MTKEECIKSSRDAKNPLTSSPLVLAVSSFGLFAEQKAVTINTKIDSFCELVPYQPLKLALPHQIVFCVDYDLGRLGMKKVSVRAEWQPVYDER
jgi:hypothetical protein